MEKNDYNEAARGGPRDSGTEGVDPRYAQIELLPAIDSMRLQVEAHIEALEAIRPSLPVIAAIATQAADRLRANPEGRVIGVGAGTPGRIWNAVTRAWSFPRTAFLMAGGRPAVFRSVEGAEDDVRQAETDMAGQNVTPGDIVIGIAASGTTPYTIAAIKAARRVGALTVGISNNGATPILSAADHGICMETGPEVVAGSTRMKAGTSQKVVLNILAAALSAQLDAQTEFSAAQHLDAHIEALRALQARLPELARAGAATVGRLKHGHGRLICVGADNEGRIAVQDLVELTPTYGLEPERIAYVQNGGDNAMFDASHARESAADAVRRIRALRLTADDVVIGVAAGPGTAFTAAAMREAARTGGALTVIFTDDAQAPLLRDVDHGIALDVGAEIASDQARLKFGTALKVALNTLTTQTMIGLHHVYKGRMVNMQDNNAKLKDRAVRMVATLAECSMQTARDALNATDRWIKRAILVARGVAVNDATDLLARHDGDLHGTLREYRAPASRRDDAPSPS